MNLVSLGWNDRFADHFQPFSSDGLVPARVASVHKHACELLSACGPLTGHCTGRLLHSAVSADLPAVGDWVAVRPRPGEAVADVHAVLPRLTRFSRRAVDGGGEQVVAANLDTVLLVSGLDANFNLRRIERYLAATWESGAQPVVVLNKADLHPDPAAAIRAAAAVAPGVPVVALSAAVDDVHAVLAPWLAPGRTLALLGSSGVGKSTLINRLLGTNRQETAAVSDAVGKGRHTTTHRELIPTPSGALLLDTPGMRELQLWDVAAGTIDDSFADVAALASHCRFRDCRHGGEPGCAIQASLDDGSLEAARWNSYLKLRREQAYAARKADPQAARATRAAWKKIVLTQRERYRHEQGE